MWHRLSSLAVGPAMTTHDRINDPIDNAIVVPCARPGNDAMLQAGTARWSPGPIADELRTATNMMSSHGAGEQRALVAEADDRRQAAMLAGDLDGLADLLSSQLIYVHTTGDTDTKASYLDAVGSGLVEYRHLERREDRCVARSGSVLCSGRQLGLSILRGEPQLIDSAYLSLWVLEAGRWQLAAWHATRYAPTRSSPAVERDWPPV